MLKVSSDIPIPYGRGCLPSAFGQRYHRQVPDDTSIDKNIIKISQCWYQSDRHCDKVLNLRSIIGRRYQNKSGLTSSSLFVRGQMIKVRIINRISRFHRQLPHSLISKLSNSCHMVLQKSSSVIGASKAFWNHYSRILSSRQNNRQSQFLDKPDLISYSLA